MQSVFLFNFSIDCKSPAKAKEPLFPRTNYISLRTMTDVFSNTKRSEVMSKIRKVNTKPELLVRSFLFKNGLRFRTYRKNLIGNPDIVLAKYKSVVFVNGCFWHAHKNCKYNKMPKSNTDYWIPKILKNVERDKRNKRELKKQEWTVHTVWECQLEKNRRDKTLEKLLQKIIA